MDCISCGLKSHLAILNPFQCVHELGEVGHKQTNIVRNVRNILNKISLYSPSIQFQLSHKNILHSLSFQQIGTKVFIYYNFSLLLFAAEGTIVQNHKNTPEGVIICSSALPTLDLAFTRGTVGRAWASSLIPP